MDSSRRSYLIAAAVTLIAMIIAALVIGVPGCGNDRPELSETPGASAERPGSIPQDPDPGEGVEVDQAYGDSGPQSVGPLQMRAVANTGATVIYNTALVRQVLYRTKTKGVTGVVNLAPVSASPTVANTVASLSARNPVNTIQKTTRSTTTVAGAKAVRVVTQVGPPYSTYSVTVVARVRGQVLTIAASGPSRKKATVDALSERLVQAAVVKNLSSADSDAVADAAKQDAAEAKKAADAAKAKERAKARAKADAQADAAKASKARAGAAQDDGAGVDGAGGARTETRPNASDYSPLR